MVLHRVLHQEEDKWHILNTFQSAEEIAAFMKAVEVAGIKIMNQRKQAAPLPPIGAPPV